MEQFHREQRCLLTYKLLFWHLFPVGVFLARSGYILRLHLPYGCKRANEAHLFSL